MILFIPISAGIESACNDFKFPIGFRIEDTLRSFDNLCSVRSDNNGDCKGLSLGLSSGDVTDIVEFLLLIGLRVGFKDII